MAATSYPSDFPLEQIKHLIAMIQEGTIYDQIDHFAFDAWNVQGFVQSIVLGQPDVHLSYTPNAEQMAALQDLDAALPKAKEMQAPAGEALPPAYGSILPWITLIMQIIEVLKKVFPDWFKK